MEQHSHCVADGVGREVAPGTSFAGSGSTVRLGDLAITCSGEDIAAQVWGAGATLAAYLDCRSRSLETPPRIPRPVLLQELCAREV